MKAIPHIIHYCWFGGKELPNLAVRCIASWQKEIPQYELRLWSEENFDISKAPQYVQEAFQQRKYAFVSDYVRLYALYTLGGIYLDTDVEVVKDFTELLSESTVLGYEDDERITTAFIACAPQMDWIKQLLERYEHRKFLREDGKMDMTTNVEFISAYLKEIGMELNGEYKHAQGIKIYPAEYFSPRSWDKGKYNVTEKTCTIHYFAGTWHSIYSRILSRVLPHQQVAKIAGMKERILSIIKRK